MRAANQLSIAEGRNLLHRMTRNSKPRNTKFICPKGCGYVSGKSNISTVAANILSCNQCGKTWKIAWVHNWFYYGKTFWGDTKVTKAKWIAVYVDDKSSRVGGG